MTTKAINATDSDVFTSDRREINITENELLGTHTYENVLYTGPETHGIVNVLDGEIPSELDRSASEAQEFADEMTREGEPDKVAKRQHPEQAVESRSAYSACAFFHLSITGGMEWHTVFRKAVESDAYDVSYNANYQTGMLTITVELAD